VPRRLPQCCPLYLASSRRVPIALLAVAYRADKNHAARIFIDRAVDQCETGMYSEPEKELSNTAYWKHFHHQADVGVRGVGPTVEEAFAQAALAMTAVISDPQHVAADRMVAIRCAAPDLELLLADWLNALIYEMAVQRMLFSRFDVSIEGHRLRASAWGEPIDRRRHRPAVEVKGATYTALRVAQEDGRWLAQCVVDV